MTNHASVYFGAFAVFVVAATLGMLMLLIVDIIFGLWKRWHGQDDSDEDGWYGGGGNGGWTDKPSGRPPSGGPDRDIDKQFNEIADAVSKTIGIVESKEEKVLL